MSVYFIGVTLMLIIIIIDEQMKRKKTKFVLPKLVYFGLVLLSGFILCSLVIWPYQDVENAPEGERWTLLQNQVCAKA